MTSNLKAYATILQDTPEEFFIGDILTREEFKKDNKIDAINNSQFFKRIQFDKHTGKVVFFEDSSTDNEYMNTHISMGDDLSDLLGYAGSSEHYINQNFYDNKSAYQARIEPNPLLYIYSDLIKPQFLSNVEVPLLRVASVQNEQVDHGRMIAMEFKHIQYIDCVTSQIRYIQFWIADQTGDLIDFADSAQTCILRLRFRKKD